MTSGGNGKTMSDSYLDCINIIGGFQVAQDMNIAGHEQDERSVIAEQARERAGYGGLDSVRLTR